MGDGYHLFVILVYRVAKFLPAWGGGGCPLLPPSLLLGVVKGGRGAVWNGGSRGATRLHPRPVAGGGGGRGTSWRSGRVEPRRVGDRAGPRGGSAPLRVVGNGLGVQIHS